MLSSTQQRQVNAIILSRALFRFYRPSVTKIGLKDSSKNCSTHSTEGGQTESIFFKNNNHLLIVQITAQSNRIISVWYFAWQNLLKNHLRKGSAVTVVMVPAGCVIAYLSFFTLSFSKPLTYPKCAPFHLVFHYHAVLRKNFGKQECIPVGCVPPA